MTQKKQRNEKVGQKTSWWGKKLVSIEFLELECIIGDCEGEFNSSILFFSKID